MTNSEILSLISIVITLIVGVVLWIQIRTQAAMLREKSQHITDMKTVMESTSPLKLKEYYEEIHELRAERDYALIEKEIDSWGDGFLNDVTTKFTELYRFIFDIIIQLPKEARLPFIEERFPTSKSYFLESLIDGGYIDRDNSSTDPNQPNQSQANS